MFAGINKIIIPEKTMYYPRKNYALSQKKLCIIPEKTMHYPRKNYALSQKIIYNLVIYVYNKSIEKLPSKINSLCQSQNT